MKLKLFDMLIKNDLLDNAYDSTEDSYENKWTNLLNPIGNEYIQQGDSTQGQTILMEANTYIDMIQNENY